MQMAKDSAWLKEQLFEQKLLPSTPSTKNLQSRQSSSGGLKRSPSFGSFKVRVLRVQHAYMLTNSLKVASLYY